jgi:hypothetical protein
MPREIRAVVRGAILDVPYEEKEEVKRLGARWDPDLRKWFVPRGLKEELFLRWMPVSDQNRSNTNAVIEN